MNRRSFARLALAGASGIAGLGHGVLEGPVASPVAPPGNRSFVHGVQFGVQPFCYHDLVMSSENRPELLRRIVQNGFGMVELHATWCEPRFYASGVPPLEVRERQREWRLSASPDYYRAIRKEFDDAEVDIFTYYVNMDASYQNAFVAYSDEEVEATFTAAQILGARGCIGSQGLQATERLAPFAGDYAMFMGVHNHSNLSDPDALNTEESFITAFSLSPHVMATFDTRHFTAANGDCLAFIARHHDRISNIHLGDRRRNQGRSAPFGEGDTPIIEILRLVRDNEWPIAVMLEFEHGTLRTGLEETQRMFDYCKRALA